MSPQPSSHARRPLRQRVMSLWPRPSPQQDCVGLRPQRGWRQRNLQFLGEVWLPSIMTPRAPGASAQWQQASCDQSLAATWLGHAGFFVQMAGCNLLIDPNWALWHGPIKRVRQPSLWASDLPPADLVLVTHAHFDHLHLPSLRRVAHGQPIIVPRGVGAVVKRCGFGEVVELDLWQKVHYRDLTITLTPAKHWGARFLHDTHRGFGGFLMEGAGRSVFHCGDSSLFDGFAEIGKRADLDLALLPIGAYKAPSGRPVHMNPAEALEAFEMLGAQQMLPMHYGTFPLGGEPMDEPLQWLHREVRSRGLGQRVLLPEEGESLLWSAA